MYVGGGIYLVWGDIMENEFINWDMDYELEDNPLGYNWILTLGEAIASRRWQSSMMLLR